jgi:spore photoproduct lyase
MQKEVDDWLQKTEKPSLLNTGELADSFAVSTAYLSHVIPLFTAQNKHVLSFLTKGDSWPDEIPVHPNLRLGWSINAAQISATYEHLAPSSTARLAAAARAKTAGYNVRIRLDPIIPIEGWETMYVQTVQDIIAIKPDFVTLRTLRAQGNLPSYASRGHAVETANPFMTVGHLMVRDGDDKALRINPDLRMEIYEKLGKLLTDAGIAWGLCKETTAVLQRLNKVNHFCNCLP